MRYFYYTYEYAVEGGVSHSFAVQARDTNLDCYGNAYGSSDDRGQFNIKEALKDISTYKKIPEGSVIILTFWKEIDDFQYHQFQSVIQESYADASSRHGMEFVKLNGESVENP